MGAAVALTKDVMNGAGCGRERRPTASREDEFIVIEIEDCAGTWCCESRCGGRGRRVQARDGVDEVVEEVCLLGAEFGFELHRFAVGSGVCCFELNLNRVILFGVFDPLWNVGGKLFSAPLALLLFVINYK